jgi:hypothetical protein
MGQLKIRNGELGMGGWRLSQISTRYVTDACRKCLPFLRQGCVTNHYHAGYKQRGNLSQIFTKFATK